MELTRRSSGVAKGGLATGIVGTVLGGLNSMALLGGGAALAGGWGRNNGNMVIDNVVPVVPMGGMFGGFGWNGYNGYGNDGCSENHLVNRYELGLQQQIAEKDAQIALRDANTYGDQKMLEMYKYIDGRLREIESHLANQAVVNQANLGRFELVQQEQKCCCDKMELRLANEAERRHCADQNIVNYLNATFVPQTIQEPAAGTTTYRQSIWNPLPGECCCNNGYPVSNGTTTAAAGA